MRCSKFPGKLRPRHHALRGPRDRRLDVRDEIPTHQDRYLLARIVRYLVPLGFDVRALLFLAVLHNKTGRLFVNGPGRREAVRGGHTLPDNKKATKNRLAGGLSLLVTKRVLVSKKDAHMTSTTGSP